MYLNSGEYSSIRDRKAFWGLIGSVERNSEHAIAKAIVSHAEHLGCTFQECHEIEIISGSGIRAQIENQWIVVGSVRLLKHMEVEIPQENRTMLESMQVQGCTVVAVAINGKFSGFISLRDAIRPEAFQVVDNLQKSGMEVWIMTGDQPITAKGIAKKLNISESTVLAGLLPQGKVDETCEMQSNGRTVLFIGDGINDAPVLSVADVGCAIGGATEIALRSADLILVKNDLRQLLTAMELANATNQRIRSNFLWAFIYNMIMMPIGTGALYSFHIYVPPALAGLSEVLSSFPVVVSSLMLNNWRPQYLNNLGKGYGTFDLSSGEGHSSESTVLIK